MSRLDWFTIAVVAICLAAILFLLSRAMNWSSVTGDTDDKTELVEDLEDAGLLEDDDMIDSDNTASDSTELSSDDASIENGDTELGEDDSDAASGDNEDSFGDDSGGDDMESDDDVPVNTSPSRSGGDYIVIAGSFSMMHNAENFAKKLQKIGYSNAYVGKFNAGKFASVIVDSFDSSAEAAALVEELKAEGIDAFSKRQK